MVFLPISTQFTQAPTTTPATSVPRLNLKKAADKAEPYVPSNDLGNRLSSLLAGNNEELFCKIHRDKVVTNKRIYH